MMKDEFNINLAEENEILGFDFKEQYVAGTSDYNKLKNKPTLNGKEIVGAMEEEDPTVSGWAKEPTKPSYTAEEVGAIKNDEIKAISLDELNSLWEGVQTWLQNIWTRQGRPYWSKKTKAELAKKVDAVDGKVLSTNDYTTAEKNKLAGIASGAQVNTITTVKVNGTALTPDASKAVDVTTPTKTSQLTNDSGYQTASQVSSAIGTAVGKITQISYSTVSSLPSTGATGVIYLVAHKHGTQDIYDEYIWMADSRTFEKIGTTDIDLSGYVKTTDLTAITTDELNAMWSAAQEVKAYARF